MEPKDILFTGWTPKATRLCIRCREVLDNEFYLLCDKCHEKDKEEREQERDRQVEIHLKRYGN